MKTLGSAFGDLTEADLDSCIVRRHSGCTDKAGGMSTHEQQIIEFLTPFAKGDHRTLELLTTSLGRVLNRAAKAGDNWRSHCTDAQAKHIADWLIADVNQDAPWLKNVDALGRNKKMLKFYDVAGIVREADKIMIIQSQKLGKVKLVSGDEEFFDDLSDGFYLVQLLTPAALDRESNIMQHCVGQGAYDNELPKKGFKILSMRDQYGKPHATLEINDDTSIYQIQGKQNKAPRRDYLDNLIEYFAVKHGDKYSIAGALSDHKLVLSENNEIIDMVNLPKNFVSKTDLNLGSISGAKLPKGLHVKGFLNCTDSEIISVSSINVEGSVMLQCMNKLKSVSKITVGRNLTINHCPEFTSLPANLKIPNGSLILNNCQKLKKLPAGLEVGNTLNLYGTSVTHLPDDIKIGRKLVTKGMKINLEELPASLPDTLIINFSAFEDETTLGKIRKAAKRREKKEAIEAEQSLGMRL